jgi:hypothetical protein
MLDADEQPPGEVAGGAQGIPILIRDNEVLHPVVKDWSMRHPEYDDLNIRPNDRPDRRRT